MKLTLYFNDYKTAFTVLKQCIDEFNQQYCLQENQAKKPLKSNVRGTAEAMLRLYLKELLNTKPIESLKELPGFRTYTSSLAKERGCTDRTIQNHRKLLEEAEIIIKQENHGGNGIHIWFNERIIIRTVQNLAQEPVDNSSPKSSSSLQKGKETKNFHPLPQDLQDLKNKDNIEGVDKCKSKNKLELFQDLLSRTRKSDVPPNKIKSSDNNDLQEAKKFFTEHFWRYANGILYPELQCSSEKSQEILNLIWRDVFYGWKEVTSREQLTAIYKLCQKRVDMASKWLMKNTAFTLPPPQVYFSKKNTSGGSFYKTLAWVQSQERKKVLNQIKSEARQHIKGKGKYRGKTSTELFTIHQQRILQYNDEPLQTSFHQMVSGNPSFYTQLHKPHYKFEIKKSTPFSQSKL